MSKQQFLWGDDEIRFEREDYIVLSLQSDPVRQILSGEKEYEFRRRFRARPTIAYIYETAPVMAVSLVIMLGKPVRGTPQEIADVADRSQPGKWQAVYDYFVDQGYGLAIPILGVKTFPQISLESLRKRFHFTAPQLYMNLASKDTLFDCLFELAGLSSIHNPSFP